jgi:site-specific DNA recombinase
MAVRTGSYKAVREVVLTRLEQARTDQSVLHRPCIQKCPDELQQPLVLDAFGDLAHQFVMVDSIEEFFQIEINHPAVALRNILLRLCHGVMRRPTRSEPIAVLGERRIPLPLQNLHHRLLVKRSSTVGMPGFRTPLPSGFGISTRLTP